MFYTIFIDLCSANNLSPTATLQKLGISTSKLTAWKKGSAPSANVLILLSEFFDVSIDFLLTGKEKSSPSVGLTADEQGLLDIYNRLSPINKGRLQERATVLAELEADISERAAEEPKIIQSIFIEYSECSVSAGTGEPLINESRPEFIEVKKSELTESANFAVKINGDSMMPHFKDNDIVLVRSQPTVEVGEIGIFIVDGSGYIKQLGKNCLVSLNPDYDDIPFEEGQDIRCKGLVIGTLEEDDFV